MKFNIIGHSFIGKSTGYYNVKKDCLMGGGEVYLYDFAKFLLKEGHDVTIIQARDKKEEFEFDGIKIKGFKPFLRLSGAKGIIERYGAFNLSWKKHIDKDADRIHLHDFLHGFPHAKKDITATCHGITWDNPFFTKWNSLGIQLRLYRAFIRKIAKYSIKHLKKVVANDSFLLRFVQSEMPQYRDKIDVIYNYVNTDLFKPENKANIRKKYPKNAKLIFYPRNFGYGRGAINSVNAMKIVAKKHPEAILLMIGEGPEKDTCKEFVKKHNLSNNVKFLGHVDHFKDMPGLFASCDMTIIPSVSTEGTSLSCLEAMATKKPVIVTNIGGLPDIVIDRFNGLICRPNAESLAEKINTYLEDKQLMKKMALKGHEWVNKRHNYRLWCKKYKEALDI